jgi:menaquinol-cytochrome c reductase iron-sulfur subunit
MTQPARKKKPVLDRRRFLERGILAIFAGLGALLGMPIVSYILSPIFKIREDLAASTQWAPIAPLSEFQTVGHLPKVFDVPYRVKEGWRFRETSRPVFVVKKGEEVIVLTAYCTHLGCPTFWSEPQQKIVCPCHGGLYNNLGQVIGGPPPRDLPRLTYKIEDGIVYLKDPAVSYTTRDPS